MAGDRFSPGARWKPSAEQLTGFAEAADWVRNEKLSGGNRPFPIDDRDLVAVTVKNETGGDRRRFEIVGLENPVFTPQDSLATFQNRVALGGAVPSLPEHVRRFGVLLRPVADGRLTKACVQGAVPVRLKVRDEAHEFARLVDGRTGYLESADAGVPVLWKDDAQYEDENGNVWALVLLGPRHEPLVPFRLEETLYPLDQAEATLLDDANGCVLENPSNPTRITARDLVDVMGPQVDPESAQGGLTLRESAPPGTCGWAQRTSDADDANRPIYNIVSLGASCCGESSASPSSSGSRSGSQPSDSDSSSQSASSDSHSSESQPSGSAPSGPWPSGGGSGASGGLSTGGSGGLSTGGSGASGASGVSGGSGVSGASSASEASGGSGGGDSQDFGSGSSDESAASGSDSSASSGSALSGSQPMPSQSDSDSDSGSDKSTAIVPASWTRDKYTALFVEECPDVRFDDVMIATVAQRDGELPIDPRYGEVCEPGTLEVCGCVADAPIAVGAKVSAGGSAVAYRFARQRTKKEVRLVIRLTGVRKGFRGHRFPNRTREQFEANERFIQSAYPGA
ncbi:MAG: hypothetical protein JW719_14485 [Pirellulales bacterium]|nr:hypothetical protein [Pirellulales bacterium]